ncbi:MAG: hypothetical protein GF401_18275 [Chitinivibrionales bacterium]|nr:hypothetical protein [Chitinivibrionales bacterium]
MRVIQVGAGVHGLRWTRWLSDYPKTEIVGIVDVHDKALKEACKIAQCDPDICFSTLDEAIKNTNAEMLVCVTPPEFHKETIIKALKADLHVISEKPMADTFASCKAIVKAVGKTRKRCVISQNFRYRPPMYTIAELSQKGKIGEIGQVKVDFYLGFDFGGGFRHEMDYPVIVDMAIHHFDYMRYITGLEPVSVQGVAWNPKWSNYKGDCSSSLIFEMSNGAHILYNTSWGAKGQFSDWNGNWQIEGEKGTITYEKGNIRFYSSPRLYTVKNEQEISPKNMTREEQMFILDNFVRAATYGIVPECEVLDNIKSMAMVFAALKAVKTGKKVPVIDKAFTELLLNI